MSPPLDLHPLESTHHRLAEGLARYLLDITDAQIRDGLMHRFELAYELCQRTLKRYLEFVSATPGEFDATPFADVIRTANEQGLLLGDWTNWKRYRGMRGKTSHTYNESTALEVAEGIPSFLAESAYLLAQLQKRLSA